MNQGPGGVRCAYIASRYPYVSHTFVLREVRALRARGVEVHTATVRRADPQDVPSPGDQEEVRTTHALLPVVRWRLLSTHMRAAARSPRGYVGTLLDALRHGPRGSRARLWQLFYFGEAILLWDWMRSLQLRHVHAHHANVASDLAMLAAAFGSRASSEPWTWSFTLHGPAELLDVDGHKLGLKATRADSVVCVSDFARAQLMALTPPSTWSKLEVVHCGVDPEEFPPVRRARRRGDRFEVLTVARLEDRKGHDVLLDAVLELERRGIELRLTLAGDGPARDRLRLRVAESGLGEVVELIGPVGHEHVARLHAQADAFCLPSFAEGVPVVLMEAMASGLPVIATRITGVPELVEDGVSGLLVAPGRPSALADAIERVIVEPSLAPALGAAARARVLDGFDIRASAEQLHGLFVRLAGTGSLARTR